MKRKIDVPRSPGMSLLQVDDGRRILLEKMRGKLAGESQAHIDAIERRGVARRKSALGWGWRIALAVMVVAGNIFWLSSNPSGSILVSKKRAPVLARPAGRLDVNEQALYWTYALYDFELLKTRFGIGKGVIVDSRVASASLMELLPKVDARTRFIIEGYIPAIRRGA